MSVSGFWYTAWMKPSDYPSPGSSYTGHVKNGVVILDAHASLEDGQAVRVEPIAQGTETQPDVERTDRVRQLQQLFAEWTEEDGKLSEEEADRLQTALEQNRGLCFGSPKLD